MMDKEITIALSDLEEMLAFSRGFIVPQPPEIEGHFTSAKVDIAIHEVPVDMLAAFLATHDDLPWRVLRWNTHRCYYSATLGNLYENRHTLSIYTETVREDSFPIPAGES